jgi:hypothetical protein
MRKVFAVSLIFAVLALSIAAYAGSISRLLPVQGRLTRPDGMAEQGNFIMTFQIWDSASGGAMAWSENWPNVAVSNGFFQLQLGSIAPLNVTFDRDYWLQVIVQKPPGAAETLSPRQQILPSAYALSLGGLVTTNGTKVKLADGTEGAGKVLTSDAEGFASWQPGVPAGAVMFFNLPSCPQGWSELTTARGRYVVGLPSGGTLGAQLGTPLTNLENRPVGQHTHTISDPGHTHSINTGNDNTVNNNCVQTGANSCNQGPRNTNSAGTGISIQNTGTTAGTNAPYIQLLVCQKS